MKKVFLWEGTTLEGEQRSGVLRASSKKNALSTLYDLSFFQLQLTPLSPDKTDSIAAPKDILQIIQSLSNLLKAGFSIKDALSFLARNSYTPISQYVFRVVQENVNRGISLQNAFQELRPLIPELFISMAGLSEHTGKLKESLTSLEEYYNDQQKRRNQLINILRYPVIVFFFSLLLFLGMVIFVVPMFQDIYSMFRGNLPVLTAGMVWFSRNIREYAIFYVAAFLGFFYELYRPTVMRLSIFLSFKHFLSKHTIGQEDFLLYSHAMKILLRSGIKSHVVAQISATVVSEANRKYALKVIQLLHEGKSFSESFKTISWFPRVFADYITEAEKSGDLGTGFDQVYQYLRGRKEKWFSLWSSMAEPLIMVFLGAIVLVMMLSIYLPLFEMGNQF